MTAETVPYDTISTSSVRSELLMNKCCFCFSLRTGCFILGYLNLVFNTFHTLALLFLTTYVGVSTHGFDHFDTKDASHVDNVIDKPFLSQICILLVVVLLVNIAWVLLNVACLIGLHKKRPGPIRVYIGFATGRLLLSLAAFVYLMITTNGAIHNVLSHGIDIAMNAYFILVYYVYAIKLEREQQQVKDLPATTTPDIAYIFLTKPDKQNLVNI